MLNCREHGRIAILSTRKVLRKSILHEILLPILGAEVIGGVDVLELETWRRGTFAAVSSR